MPELLDTRIVVTIIRETLEDAVFDHDVDLLAAIYTILVLKETDDCLTPHKDYFMVVNTSDC